MRHVLPSFHSFPNPLTFDSPLPSDYFVCISTAPGAEVTNGLAMDSVLSQPSELLRKKNKNNKRKPRYFTSQCFNFSPLVSFLRIVTNICFSPFSPAVHYAMKNICPRPCRIKILPRRKDVVGINSACSNVRYRFGERYIATQGTRACIRKMVVVGDLRGANVTGEQKGTRHTHRYTRAGN